MASGSTGIDIGDTDTAFSAIHKVKANRQVCKAVVIKPHELNTVSISFV